MDIIEKIQILQDWRNRLERHIKFSPWKQTKRRMYAELCKINSTLSALYSELDI